MAPSRASLAFSLLSRTPRPLPKRNPSRFACLCPCQRRQLHPSLVHRQTRDKSASSEDAESLPWKFDIDALNPRDRAKYEKSSAGDQQAYRDEQKTLHDTITTPKGQAELEKLMARMMSDPMTDLPSLEFEETRVKPGYHNLGEDEPQFMGEDETYQGDDLNELGHAELDKHRDIRHYARIAAWEMPLLTGLAKPFELPSPEHVLRFRYTTYMGEEHPAGKKIVLEFCTGDLPDLTPSQRIKLVKLVGSRYNPETDTVKMSCEMFETPAQNKRYLGDLVDDLLAEARNGADTFDDVPLDFRHHKFRPTPIFPESWKLTSERVAQLSKTGRSALEAGAAAKGEENLDVEGEYKEEVLEGARVIEQALAALPQENLLESAPDPANRRGPAKRSGRQMLR